MSDRELADVGITRADIPGGDRTHFSVGASSGAEAILATLSGDGLQPRS